MKMKVVGYRDVDFTDDKTNRRIQGTSLYVVHSAENVVGQIAEKMFLNPNTLFDSGYSPAANDTIDVEFGPHGRVVGIKKLSADGK